MQQGFPFLSSWCFILFCFIPRKLKKWRLSPSPLQKGLSTGPISSSPHHLQNTLLSRHLRKESHSELLSSTSCKVRENDKSDPAAGGADGYVHLEGETRQEHGVARNRLKITKENLRRTPNFVLSSTAGPSLPTVHLSP